MQKIKAILIDDEISAINTLRGMLEQYFPQVKIIAVSHTINIAYELILKYQPDLLFLDIEMPPLGNGFDLLKKCEEFNFGVIFTTAYPKYAVQAINDTQPWAYLVKPYSIKELGNAIENASEKISLRDKSDQTPHLILPDTRKGNVIIPVNKIIYCQADGATVDIHYKKEDTVTTFTASRTLKDIEDRLPENSFCRNHHSYMVNLSFVERFEQTGRNGIIYLNIGKQIPVSVSKLELFSDKLYEHLNK